MSHSVLIIDDDEAMRGVLTSVLEARGYETVVAANGAEAVHRLVEEKPCVIVLDFEMPVMDGHDFREVQKRLAPDVPIICLTGAADPEQTGRVVGAARILAKPMDIDELCSTVTELCAVPHAHRHTAAVQSTIEQDRRLRS